MFLGHFSRGAGFSLYIAFHKQINCICVLYFKWLVFYHKELFSFFYNSCSELVFTLR